MNDTTIKALSIIEMTGFMTTILKQEKYVENELKFIGKVSDLLTAHTEIDTSKVNGNELYVTFCSDIGNEQTGWK